MKSIRFRLFLAFFIVILLTVGFLEVFLITTVQRSYYNDLEQSLRNQAQVSVDIYSKYFSDTPLKQNVLSHVDTFWNQNTAEVQILDVEGNLLLDSLGSSQKNLWQKKDVKKALSGETGVWQGTFDSSSEKVMTVSVPLYNSAGEIDGVLRLVSSLRQVRQDVRDIALIFIGLGLIVAALSAGISFYLSKSILIPLREVSRAAGEMAAGDFNVRSKKLSKDEVGQLSDTLNLMADEVCKSEKLKNEFISSVTHELKTPLTSIKGWAITLKNGDLDDRALLTDGLDIIESESDRLTGMVEELLDFSKLMSGNIILKKRKVDISQLLMQLYKQFEPRAAKGHIDFKADAEGTLPVTYADDNRLKQLFINLLENAFQFTPANGSIRIHANYTDDRFNFVIEDTGCGIPENELPRVREKFFKGSHSKSQNGIGLAVCDEIVRLMNGKFEIHSKVGDGTRITVSIPFEQPKEDEL